MGNFSNNSITDAGKMLLADVQAGAVFTPTRIVIGSGSMPSGATAKGMTDVITPVKSLEINKKKRTPDGKCVFGGAYTNVEVTEPFYFRELALYAKTVYLNEDGSVKSETAETLYSYGNAGATADYMPAYSASTVVEKQIDLIVWVGNDAQVDLTIASGVYVNKSGDDLTGWLTFKNYNDYFSIVKGRTIADGKTHFLTLGTGSDGSTTIEHYTCDTSVFDGEKRDGRLDLNPVLINGVPNRHALVLRGSNANNQAYRIYGEHNKPTPAEIGAASKSGDTLTGKLAIQSSSPTYEFRDTAQGDDGMINMYSHNIQIKKRNIAGDDTNFRRLIVKDSKSGADIKNAIVFGDKVNGVETFYDVIHTGNLHLINAVAGYVSPATVE